MYIIYLTKKKKTKKTQNTKNAMNVMNHTQFKISTTHTIKCIDYRQNSLINFINYC